MTKTTNSIFDETPRFRTAYDGVQMRSTDLHCLDESLTKQAFLDECDINGIVKRALAGEVITHVAASAPVFGDASAIPDYQTALNIVIDAQKEFDALPSALRARFDNNPAKFLDFVSTASTEALIEAGLASQDAIDRYAAQSSTPPSKIEAADAASGNTSGA